MVPAHGQAGAAIALAHLRDLHDRRKRTSTRRDRFGRPPSRLAPGTARYVGPAAPRYGLLVRDLGAHESLGDPESPFSLTPRHERVQRERERLRDATRCAVAPLTYEAYAAGEPCPGCGRPYRDEERWEVRGTANLTAEERVRYDAEQEAYKSVHGSCGSHRHSVSGSLTMHCGKCCPAPPLSPSQITRLGQLLGTPAPPHDLMRWRLRLFCGHVTERQSHITHRTVQAAFSGAIICPDCGLEPASIIDAVAVGPVGEPETPRGVCRPSSAKASRAHLEARVRELEAEVERLRADRRQVQPRSSRPGPA